MSVSRILGVGLICGVVFSMSGCAYLYRADEDQAAQQASKAYSDAEFGKALAAEREALVKRQAERQELVKRSQLALRNAALARVVGGTTAEFTWGALESWITRRLITVQGMEVPKLPGQCAKRRIGELRSDLGFQQDQVDLARLRLLQRLSATGQKLDLPCTGTPTVLPAPASADAGAVALAARFDAACSNLGGTQMCLEAFQQVGGELVQTHDRIETIRREKAVMAKEVKQVSTEYEQELKRADEIKGTAGIAKELAKRLEEILKKFDGVAAKAKSLGDNPVLAGLLEEASVEKLTKQKEVLERYVSALSGKEPDKTGTAEHRTYLVANLVNRITERPAPPTAGIILQIEIYRQQIAAGNARIRRADESIHLLESKRGFLMDELDFLQQARSELDAAKTSGCDTTKDFYTSTASANVAPDCRLHATRALVAFNNAWTLGKLSQELVDYRLIDQQELAALSESEAAVRQTETVIKAALDQITKLYASGLKPEQISALVQALGLGAIAVRVR